MLRSFKIHIETSLDSRAALIERRDEIIDLLRLGGLRTSVQRGDEVYMSDAAVPTFGEVATGTPSPAPAPAIKVEVLPTGTFRLPMCCPQPWPGVLVTQVSGFTDAPGGFRRALYCQSCDAVLAVMSWADVNPDGG